MASFEEIMNKPVNEIKSPPPLPVGTYHCIVDENPTVGQARTGNKCWQYKYKIVAAGDDVDQREAAEQQVIGKVIPHDHYVTDNPVTHNMLKEFCIDTLGIEAQDGGGKYKSLGELVAESRNRQLRVKIKHELSTDGKRVFIRVESTARV